VRLLVAGAGGRTGRLLTELALERGHEVTALVRSGGSLSGLSGERLHVLVGDVMVPETLPPAMLGQDAVISTLAPRPRTNGQVYVDGTRNLANAAVRAGVRRFVVVSAEGAGVERGRLDLLYRLVLHIPVVARLYPDIAKMEDELRARDDLDWTIVRPPLLTNGAPRGTYREVVGDVVPKGLRLARADLAEALLRAAETDAYVRERVAVAY
jgi:putative NADH-flavin reductase